MAAIPTGPDALAVTARHIHVGLPGDFQYASPITDAKRNIVPFGTNVWSYQSNDYFGTIQSGEVSMEADKKERPDGNGGVEDITYTNIRWTAKITATFRVLIPSTGSDVPTAGTGPVKVGDLVEIGVPKVGAAIAAASTTTQRDVFDQKVFSIDKVTFKFSNGEYATYDIEATHNVGLHDGTVTSNEVDEDGDVVQIQDEAINAA